MGRDNPIRIPSGVTCDVAHVASEQRLRSLCCCILISSFQARFDVF